MPDRFGSAGGWPSPKPDARTDAEVRRHFVLEHQRHAIDEQRFDDARDETLGQAMQIEVAVEVARKADQRAAVVVAIAIERAVEHVLHDVLDRRRKQQRHERRQERDHPVVLGCRPCSQTRCTPCSSTA